MLDSDTTIVSHLLLARFPSQHSGVELHDAVPGDHTASSLSSCRTDIRAHRNAQPASRAERTCLPVHLQGGWDSDGSVHFVREHDHRGRQHQQWEHHLQGDLCSCALQFRRAKTGLKLDQEKIDIKSFKFDGNPLNKMWPFALDGILTVEIVEVDAVTPRSTTAHVRVSSAMSGAWTRDLQGDRDSFRQPV